MVLVRIDNRGESGDDREYACRTDELKESNSPAVRIVERIGGGQRVEELEAPLNVSDRIGARKGLD